MTQAVSPAVRADRSDGRAPASEPRAPAGRVRTDGKFFRIGDHSSSSNLGAEGRWYVKGLTYGPFAPNASGDHLPGQWQWQRDLAHLRAIGANAVRVYHPPPTEFLDDAAEAGVRVLIDVPWEKHRCFFEDYAAERGARRNVRQTARALGRHPAVLGLSVANEIPRDVVRFYGAARVERLLQDLLATVKDEAPGCLATYTNYPSTEYLSPRGLDFYCANVYLEDPVALARYLARLQHVAGPLPLVLGEYGMDSIRNGLDRQAEAMRDHLRAVFGGGLAGSFVFAYTDEWYTGGHPIRDWAFGVTDRDRMEKPAAAALRELWPAVPHAALARADQAGLRRAQSSYDAPPPLPRVSVVVCSYNGAATLEECLGSLGRLDYPDYEVILVDDGSTDDTPQIARQFPHVRHIRQPNNGLSHARNVGARAATGQVVAYTDADCVADPLWLTYLVRAMQEQGVDAIGGPNLPPPDDSWVARCVAASPGGPSHVMIDDLRAEHVPGCNMAFSRATLLGLGAFDPQFRQAGDDVDICWRLLDAGHTIGYAPAAFVWHHRRTSLAAYLRQQKGYGRAEAMLHFKHPQRFNSLGCSRWAGVIYGEGAVGLPAARPPVFHGRFGTSPYQIIYRRNGDGYSAWGYVTLLEWHALAALLLAAAAASGSVMPAIVAAGMWLLSMVGAARTAATAPLPRGAPWWCWPIVFAHYLLQPATRAWHRYAHRLKHRRAPAVPLVHVHPDPAGRNGADAMVTDRRIATCSQRTSWRSFDLYWDSTQALGRDELLDALVAEARELGWPGELGPEWDACDAKLIGDRWHDVELCTATEELGWPRRFTRVRCVLQPTRSAGLLAWAGAALTGAVVIGGALPALAVATAAWTCGLIGYLRSRHRCRQVVSRLVWRAGCRAGLAPVLVRPTADAPPRPATTIAADRFDNGFDETDAVID